MAISKKQFIDKYLEELLDHVQVIENSIIILKHDPANIDELGKILRALHSIKGSSRMLKLSNTEKIAHGLENVFKGVKDKRYTVNNAITELVFITIDYLRFGSEKIRDTMEDEFECLELLKVFEKVYAVEPFSLAEVLVEKALLSSGDSEIPEGSCPDPDDRTGGEEPCRPSLTEATTVRINTATVSDIVTDMNDLILKQMQFKKGSVRFSNLVDETEELFRFLKRNTDKSLAYELSQYEKSLSQQLSRLYKRYAAGQALVEKDTFKIQEKMTNLSMLPVNMIFGSLERMVEETAVSLNKEIRLSTSGLDVQLDKNVLEKIQDPVIHIIRNSVDHGIELPDERAKNGKNRSGAIQLSCRSERGKIIISIKDDGRGLDYEKIRKKAVRLYPEMEEKIQAMKEEELNTYLFASGFSTRTKVSELSGRGVGLDIVKNNIEKIKGSIEIISRKNTGTEFILTLPLSLATSNGYFISCAKHKFFLPTEFVERIVTIDRDDIVKMGSQTAFKLEDRILPLYDLASLLHENTEHLKKLNVVVIKSFDDTVGMIVETIIERSQLIFKSLPPLIADLDAVQGIVFDEFFNMICILHIPVLISRFKGMKSIDRNISFSRTKGSSGRILVVEDSEYTRDIEKSILQKENFQVDTATDGIDALEKIRAAGYNLIITDVEMPRMNGFILVENIRKNEHNAEMPETPVLVVSGSEEKTITEKLYKFGNIFYLSKSGFERREFIAKVNTISRVGEKHGS